jgi:preprotein translocase subunit SecB
MAPSDVSAATPSADGQAQAPRELVINAQYVKDMSFENPRAPQSLMQAQQQPEVQVGVDVKAQNIAPGFYEVLLTLHAEAKSNNERIFLIELVYGAVASVGSLPEPEIGRALLVDAPRFMFPFARAIIASATREGGFLPLMLQPIDFAQLLQKQQQVATERAGGAVA